MVSTKLHTLIDDILEPSLAGRCWFSDGHDAEGLHAQCSVQHKWWRGIILEASSSFMNHTLWRSCLLNTLNHAH